MIWIRGNDLSETNKRAVLNMFVHRMTVENVKARPEHAAWMYEGGYRMPIVSDSEWLASKAFPVTKRGTISERHKYCVSAEDGEIRNNA